MGKPLPPQKFGLAIDWETSGYSIPDYASKHSGISFGAAIFDTKTFEVVESLYCEIQPDPTKLWDMGAEKIHGLTRDHLAVYGITREAAAIQLASMVIKYIGTGKVIPLGHRVHFDIAFTNDLLKVIDVELEWDPIKMDSAALAAILLHETSSDGLFNACGFTERTEHNSLEDILLTLESVRTLKLAFLEGRQQLLNNSTPKE
jgi:hypothetical protein